MCEWKETDAVIAYHYTLFSPPPWGEVINIHPHNTHYRFTAIMEVNLFADGLRVTVKNQWKQQPHWNLFCSISSNHCLSLNNWQTYDDHDVQNMFRKISKINLINSSLVHIICLYANFMKSTNEFRVILLINRQTNKQMEVKTGPLPEMVKVKKCLKCLAWPFLDPFSLHKVRAK